MPPGIFGEWPYSCNYMATRTYDKVSGGKAALHLIGISAQWFAHLLLLGATSQVPEYL
jgi:hypothetical protein